MRRVVTAKDWHESLVDAIKTSIDGDQIVCLTMDMAELGELARQRIRPGLDVSFVVSDTTERSQKNE